MPVTISGELLNQIEAFPVPSVQERANNLLMAFAAAIKTIDQKISPNTLYFQRKAFTGREREVRYLLNFLSEEGFVTIQAGGTLLDTTIGVTPKGFSRVEELRAKVPASDQGFVAMWFGDAVAEAFTAGIAPALLDAGYRAFRVDQKEHVNKIDDEIIMQIRRSKFVVADFTGHRGGVYFESGFAMGLGLPVIWTCREDAMGDLHFDIRQYNTISWQAPADLRAKLSRRVEAVVGRGPVR
ncbi:hypothetical protein V6B08_19810 [Ferrovibrio sp. MS7]|uniref:hypothetical protein n=1 Tax=Ferrovibrio plantarum TaxID=3119164 RepID=UPI003134CA60